MSLAVEDRNMMLRIVGVGALGGLLSWIFAVVAGGATSPPVVHALYYASLGAGAGFFGVYLVARTDKAAPVHMLALALACGFSWKPMYESLDALLKRQMTDQAAAAVAVQAQQVRTAGQELKTVAEAMAAPASPEESGPIDRRPQIDAINRRLDAVLANPVLPPAAPPRAVPVD